MCVSALAGRKERSCSFALGGWLPLQLPLSLICGPHGWQSSSSSPVTLCCSFSRLWARCAQLQDEERPLWKLESHREDEGPTWVPALPLSSHVALASPCFMSIFPPDHDLEAPASDAERTAYLDGNRLPQQQEVVLFLLDSLDHSPDQHSLKVSSHSWLLVTMGKMVTTLLPTIGY